MIQESQSTVRVLITAGPTREHIDPVRYISNESTGKMGYAIAEAFLDAGMDVTLISGPVHIGHSVPVDKIIHVNSALEMYEVARCEWNDADIVIFTAAVADYRVETVAQEKIKKNDDELTLQLVKNPDIAFEFGKVKRADQFSVGFALETENLLENARKKLFKKNLDLVVLNSAKEVGAGFGWDTNRVTFVFPRTTKEFIMKQKRDVAFDILEAVQLMIQKQEVCAQ